MFSMRALMTQEMIGSKNAQCNTMESPLVNRSKNLKICSLCISALKISFHSFTPNLTSEGVELFI